MISVVCGVMDREESLLKALPNWLEFPDITEIVVTDWSSRVPLAETTRHLRDPRVRVIRVAGRHAWRATQCHNLGIRMATRAVILRLDADHLLEKDFFARHVLSRGAFFHGDWRLARDDNERHLTGAMLIEKQHLLRVNGYNERIRTYGYEDLDLYARLTRAGLRAAPLDFSTMRHIPHPDSVRVQRQDVTDIEAENRRNQALAERYPWTSRDVMTRWRAHRGPDGAVFYEPSER